MLFFSFQASLDFKAEEVPKVPSKFRFAGVFISQTHHKDRRNPFFFFLSRIYSSWNRASCLILLLKKQLHYLQINPKQADPACFQNRLNLACCPSHFPSVPNILWDLCHIAALPASRDSSSSGDTDNFCNTMYYLFLRWAGGKQNTFLRPKVVSSISVEIFPTDISLWNLGSLNIWIFYIKQRFKHICVRHQVSDCWMFHLFLEVLNREEQADYHMLYIQSYKCTRSCLFGVSFFLPSLGFTFSFHVLQCIERYLCCFHISRKFYVFFRVPCELSISLVESISQDLPLSCLPLLLPTVLQTKIMIQ